MFRRARQQDLGPATTEARAVYPYLVNDAYLGSCDPAVVWPLGHGISMTLVHDASSVVQGVTVADLGSSTPEAARGEALNLLFEQLKGGAVGSRVFPQGPSDRPFALLGGHWGQRRASCFRNCLDCWPLTWVRAWSPRSLTGRHFCCSPTGTWNIWPGWHGSSLSTRATARSP